MNKKLLILPLLLVSITSCSPTQNESSSSNSSQANEVEVVKILTTNTFNPYVLRSSTTITNGTTTISSSYSNYEVNTEKKILHNYGSKNIFYKVDDPQGQDKTFESFDIYYTPTKAYTMGSDGKYVITEKTSEVKVFTVSYDFSYLKDTTYTNTKFTGKVNKNDIASFFTKSVDGVESDISISGTIQVISEQYKLTEIALSYTSSGNSTTSISINYEYSMPDISLPTV